MSTLEFNQYQIAKAEQYAARRKGDFNTLVLEFIKKYGSQLSKVRKCVSY